MSKLFAKTLVVIVILFGMVALVTSVFSGWFMYKRLTDEYESKAVAIAEAIASSSLEVFLNRDESTIQSIIDQHLGTEGVAYVLVSYEDGEVVSHTFVPKVPEDIYALISKGGDISDQVKVTRLSMENYGEVLDVSSPILSGTAGYVHVGMDLSPVRSYIWSTILTIQGITFVIFLISVFVAYSFMNSISRPLKDLTAYADRLAEQDYSATIEVETRDEVGALAATMSHMAVEIKSHITGLKEANERLKREIQEHKQTQYELSRAEEKFRSIFENAIEGIYQVAPDGTILSANPAMARILDYEDHWDLMDRVRDFRTDVFLQPGEAKRLFARLMREGRVMGSVVRLVKRSGDPIWCEVNARAVAPEDDRVAYFEGTVEDISERIKAQEEIQSLNQELEQRVRERTADLESALRELEAFSYSVSHDLRAPLRSVHSFCNVLMEDFCDQLDEEGQGYLERVVRAGRHMEQLIDDLLQLSKVARTEMHREKVDLSAMAGEIIGVLDESEPEREVQTLVSRSMKAQGDPGLIRVLLQNLLGNAWKFTSKKENALIEFGCTSRNGVKEYFVRDNGAGFDMEYAGKLFEPFNRLHNPSDFEGTGVGLAIVERVVRRHGGTIRAEGEPGKGAAFHFTLESSGLG